jgi:hypothetical protein
MEKNKVSCDHCDKWLVASDVSHKSIAESVCFWCKQKGLQEINPIVFKEKTVQI